jgi:hypothetical protein
VFLAGQKAPHKTPHSPRIPPQIHHTLTTTKHQKIAKPPPKTTLSRQIFFPKNKTLPSPFSPSKPIGKSGTAYAASEVVLPYPAPQT